MDDIAALRLFLAIAETGGLARAARRLGLTAAVASRRLAHFERALGTRLFLRTTRRVVLTEEGQTLLPHAERIVEALETAAASLASAGGTPSGRLRVLSRATLGRALIVPHLAAFRARYPAVSIGLEFTESGAGTLDVLGSGCDLGFTVGHLDDSSLRARRLAETDSHLYASPDYLRRYGTPRTPGDLAHHACLTINSASGTNTWQLSAQGQHYAMPIRAAVAINDAESLLACARAGLGILVIADWTAAEHVARGELVEVLPDCTVEPRGTPISVLYPGRGPLPPKARVFIEFLAEVVAERLGRRPLPRA